MLELKQVSFSYPQRPLFENLNLRFAPGSRTALLGQSGRGKTTLLHMLCGLIQPQSGSISGIPQQGVAVVFQEDRLFEQLTIAENLLAVAPELTQKQMEQMLSSLLLPGILHQYPSQLSGGMRRRAAIARALCFHSPLIILDEPFKGLDSGTKQAVLQTVDTAAANRTLILVTHDPAEAAALRCSCIAL